MRDNRIDEKTKRKSIGLMFKNLFSRKKNTDVLIEDDIQTPFMTIVNTFKDNKVAMTSLFIFLGIFLLVLIGPFFNPLDLSYVETTQGNIAPGFDMLNVPAGLSGHIKNISVGPTFSAGISDKGKIYVWGKTKISPKMDLKNIPKSVKAKSKDIVKLSCGTDHILALLNSGEVIGWGSDRLKQIKLPEEIKGKKIVDITAGSQISYAIDDKGNSYAWGNKGINDYLELHQYQGQLQKIVASADTACAMTKDGKAVFLGAQPTAFSRIPDIEGKVTDIAASSTAIAVITDNGNITVWGNIKSHNELNIPQNMDGKPVKIYGGRYHFIVLTDKNKIYGWGDNNFGQINIPQELNGKKIKDVYVGYYDNHVVTEDNKVYSFGHRGYLLGTDDLGRDIWNRILNGGRKSMTIGAIAVIIATIIGIIVGGVSGFAGGALDNILQRLSEIVGSLPFLPFAMILSSLVGQSMKPNEKIIMIMVILGLLSWTGLQRLVRAQVLSIREQEYVIAARSLGIKESSIIFKHILPNTISIIIVSATLSFASSMLTESSLSFLGFGVPAPYPTWGNMLNGANNSVVIQNYWWRWVFPSIILGVCVICINLIGDGLRDAIDPKSQER